MDGGSIAGTLFIVFLVLKLTHTIHWSWLWVTSPIWIDAILTTLFVVLIATGLISGFGILKRIKRDLDF